MNIAANNITANEVLARQAETRPNDTAFIFHDIAWTFKKVAAEVTRLAQAMAAYGVGPGDRVAIHMMNRPEFVLAYYACFALGAIAVPLRTAFTFAELAPILKRVQPRLYLGEIALYGNVAPTDTALLPVSRRFLVDSHLNDDESARPWEALLAGACDDVILAPAPDKPAVLITTSGTTGQPKFVAHTPETLAAMTGLMLRTWDIFERDVVALPMPLAHVSGLASVLCYIQRGTRFVLLERFDPDEVLDVIQHYRTTIHAGFPAQYVALLAAQKRRPRDVGSLRFCLTGADICPISLQQQVTSTFGAPLYNVWGATETLGQLTYGLRFGPVQRINQGVQFRLVDDRGQDVANGEIGELWLRGDNVFVGYWNDPEATAAALQDGWYRTGDLMRHGDGDELWFVSRKKDIIIRGGTNISPAEIEDAIVAAHPNVEEAVVVGVPDETLGQRVFAFVKLASNGGTTMVSQIVGVLATRLAAYKMPEAIIVVDKLPRNALSKVDRQMLLAMAIQADRDRRSSEAPAQPVRIRAERPLRVVSNR